MRESVLEIVKNYQMRILVMAQKKYEEVLDTIIRSSVHVRFVGAIGSKGELLAYKRRAGLKPMMDANSTKYHFSQVALKNDMESFFDKNLGNVEFVWEEREKVQTIAFTIKKITMPLGRSKRTKRASKIPHLHCLYLRLYAMMILPCTPLHLL